MKKAILAITALFLHAYGFSQESKGVITEAMSPSEYRTVLSGHSNGEWVTENENFPELNMKVYIVRDEKSGDVCVTLPTNSTHTIGETVDIVEKKKKVNSDWIENTCAIRISRP